jgi:hypothetical protein
MHSGGMNSINKIKDKKWIGHRKNDGNYRKLMINE